jgi:S1-C subfamily serine protease
VKAWVATFSLLAALAPGCYRDSLDTDDPVSPVEPAGSASDWEAAVEHVANGVVVLRVTVPRDFSTFEAGTYMGTGFVVDAERGLILTNRHLVQPGPVVAQAVFRNHEEVDIRAVYRDPVHDFGLFQFDPEDVRFGGLTALSLTPESARVGLDIRVVGNDAGERLSILDSVLARLDRPAPTYGENTYNDFNTLYYQAASDTSGGSSGSPVVDINGDVVALNAGGHVLASSSFYLPLHRVIRALDLVREGQPVPRGTLQTTFAYESYDELRRLGLREETEAEARSTHPGRIGMLVVERVLPEGPAAEQLEVGDILIRVAGHLTTSFIELEGWIDDHVGEEVALDIERGGEAMQVMVTIQDLYEITPREFIEVGRAVLHSLSYQQARNFNLPVRGVRLVQRGYMFSAGGLFSGALIEEIDGQPVEDLDSLWEFLTRQRDRTSLVVRYRDGRDPGRSRVATVQMDRRWFPLRRCRLDDVSGEWRCREAPRPQPSLLPIRGNTVELPTSSEGPAGNLAASMVLVDFDIPYRVAGVWASHFRGTGVILDADRGLVVVDRNTVPISLGDITLTFGRSLRVSAQIAYLHPTHNFAIVQYNPAEIGNTPVVSVTLSDQTLERGDPVWLVGLDEDYRVVVRETAVSRVSAIGPDRPRRPQFRDSNVDLINIEDPAPTVGGVLVDEEGAVAALWVSIHDSADRFSAFGGAALSGDDVGAFRGIPAELIEMVAAPLRENRFVHYRTLGVEWRPISLADAAERGLPYYLADDLEAHDPQRRQALEVTRVYSTCEGDERPRGGDILIAIDGESVTRFIEVERASQRDRLQVRFFRDGSEIQFDMETQQLSGSGIVRVLVWGGALLHEPHLELATQRSLSPRGLYVAWRFYGSPAARYGLPPTSRIIGVNGAPTNTLDAFIEAVAGVGEDESIRLRVLDLADREHAITIRLDQTYWPSWTLTMGFGGWIRQDMRE